MGIREHMYMIVQVEHMLFTSVCAERQMQITHCPFTPSPEDRMCHWPIVLILQHGRFSMPAKGLAITHRDCDRLVLSACAGVSALG